LDEEETSMSAEENNMALARRLMEARVEGDWDALVEMIAPDFVSHTKLVSGQPPGREGAKWAIAQLNAALSNRSIYFEDQVAAGYKVVSRFVVHETHDRGELMGVAPSGRAMTNKTIMIHRISEGKIAEEWSIGTLGLN
jgi:predicted ester cyclase